MERQQLQVNEIVSVHIKSEKVVDYNEDTDSDSVVNEDNNFEDSDLVDEDLRSVYEDVINESNDNNSTGKVSDTSETSIFSRVRWKRLFGKGRGEDIDEGEWDDNGIKYDQEFVPFSDRSLLNDTPSYSIGLRDRIAKSSLVGRILRRNKGGPEYYMTLASELNNVAAHLYNHKQFSTAMDLLKDAVRAVKTCMDPDKKEWQELAPLDDTKNIARKIVHGKELAQNMELQDLAEPSKLDIFHWPQSVQSHNPKWLLSPLFIALQTNNQHQNEQQQLRKYGCIGAFILFNLGLIHLQRQQYPAALKYFQMAVDLIPKDSSEHFHHDYIVLISLHNNIGSIEYQQSYGNVARMSQVALEEFQFAFYLCRLYRASLREYENTTPAASSYEDTTKIINIQMGTIATNIARVYFDRKQDDEAMDLCNDALESFILAYGEGVQHIDVATSYYNLGVIHHKNENYEKAMECYDNFFNFIGTQQRSKGSSMVTDISFVAYTSEDITTALLNALIVLCKQSFFQDKNSELYELVSNLQSLRCDFGYEHPNIPGVLDEIGNLLKELNENDYVPYIFDEKVRVEDSLYHV